MKKDESKVGLKIRNLRMRSGISLRKLAKDAGVSVSYLSGIEKDSVSPTLATLRKVLTALDTNFFDFFNDKESNNDRYFFKKAGMRTVSDKDREYTFVFPHRDDIPIEVMDENYFPGKKICPFEIFESDFSGYVLSGEMMLEIGDEPTTRLSGGDAFFVPRGTRVRGYCEKGKTSRVISMLYPVRKK